MLIYNFLNNETIDKVVVTCQPGVDQISIIEDLFMVCFRLDLLASNGPGSGSTL